MKKIRLTESDLIRLVERIINEQRVLLSSPQNEALLPSLLKFYQQKNGLNVTGVVDKPTYDLLIKNKQIPYDKFGGRTASSGGQGSTGPTRANGTVVR